MCAILDASVVSEVFARNCPPAGRAFADWIVHRHGRLIVGGKVERELRRNKPFKKWIQGLLLSGKARRLSVSKVDDLAAALEKDKRCQSNDAHVIALAQLSGARLLYSNDINLNLDFVNPDLVPPPRGCDYSTLKEREFTRDHQALLKRRDLCTRPVS
jgi:predicted nucleic acid-binding protein